MRSYRTPSRAARTNGLRGRMHAVREALVRAGKPRYLSTLIKADPSLSAHRADIEGWISSLRNVPDAALPVVLKMEAALKTIVK